MPQAIVILADITKDGLGDIAFISKVFHQLQDYYLNNNPSEIFPEGPPDLYMVTRTATSNDNKAYHNLKKFNKQYNIDHKIFTEITFVDYFVHIKI